MNMKVGSSGEHRWFSSEPKPQEHVDTTANKVQIGAGRVIGSKAAASSVQNVSRNTISAPFQETERVCFSREQLAQLATQAKGEVLYKEAKKTAEKPDTLPGTLTNAFLRAAQCGNLKAAFKLILLRSKGWGVRKTKGIEDEIEKGKNSNARALCQEARGLEKSEKFEDLQMARAMYEAAAEKQDATALYKAAEFHRRGIGGDVDKDKALHYYAEASENNSAMAAYELAKMYRNGYAELGVDRDEKKYNEYLKRAASLGNREALKEYDPIALKEKAAKNQQEGAPRINHGAAPPS